MIPRVLSIAGTDPTGGAGIQADIKAITAAGGFALSVTTSLVAQNTHGVREIHTPPPEFLRAQLDAVFDDVDVDAVKIGMLGSAATTRQVTEYLREHPVPIIVLDPVMIASSGDSLIDSAGDAIGALRDLASLATVVTPNIPELAVLADQPEAATFDQAVDQAQALADELGTMVLVKGGHLSDGPMLTNAAVAPTPTYSGLRMRAQAPDMVIARTPRVATTNTHGTGCSLSAALATRLVHHPVDAALEWTTTWLAEAIRAGADLHVGRPGAGGHGPIDHSAQQRRLADAAIARPWDATERPDCEPLLSPESELLALAWDKARGELARLFAGPFVRGLIDGSIERQDWEFYQSQLLRGRHALNLDYINVDTTAVTYDRAAFAALTRRSANPAVRVVSALAHHWVSGEITARLLQAHAVTAESDLSRGPSGTQDYAAAFVAANSFPEAVSILSEAALAYSELTEHDQQEFVRAFATAVYHERQFLEQAFRCGRYA